MSFTTLALIIAAVILVVFIIHTANRAHIRRLRASGLYPPDGRGTVADVERLLREGYKVSAIKLYRQINKVDLKTARNAVEKMARDLPPGYVKR